MKTVASRAHRRLEAGVSLVELIVATAIAAIAVAGLAHSFGVGRAQIERFTVARAALAAAEERMEILSRLPVSHADLTVGTHASTFAIDGQTIGNVQWVVSAIPKNWGVYADYLTRIDVEVTWNQTYPDTVRLSRSYDR